MNSQVMPLIIELLKYGMILTDKANTNLGKDIAEYNSGLHIMNRGIFI